MSGASLSPTASSTSPTPTVAPVANPLVRLRESASAAMSSVLDSASLSLSLGSSDNEAPSATVVAESPGEYRNLLISLSSEKLDHVLWIECLKQYHWEGDRQSEFEFTLDKFGVPHLKNGGYKLNLCHDCLDLVEAQQSAIAAAVGAGEDEDREPGFSFIWEGNHLDSGAEDFARLEAASIAVVVRKCANVLNALFANAPLTIATNEFAAGQKNLSRSGNGALTAIGGPATGRPVVAYMPNVVQLFILQVAAARVGAVLTFINASIYKKAADVAEILDLSSADTVFTVDGFFIGDRIHETKRTLDEAIEKLKADTNSSRGGIRSVVVVRHIGANLSVPAPAGDRPANQLPAYGLDIPYTESRDCRWSELMLAAGENCECEWLPAEHPIFNTIRAIEPSEMISSPESESYVFEANPEPPRWRLEPYTVSQIALLVRLVARQLRAGAQTVPAAVGPVWPLIDGDDLLFLSATMAVPLAGFALLMCESPPTLSGSARRFFEILLRHDVRQLLLSERHAQPLIDTKGDGLDENEAVDGSLEQLYTVSAKRRADNTLVERLAIHLPHFRHLHLHC